MSVSGLPGEDLHPPPPPGGQHPSPGLQGSAHTPFTKAASSTPHSTFPKGPFPPQPSPHPLSLSATPPQLSLSLIHKRLRDAKEQEHGCHREGLQPGDCLLAEPSLCLWSPPLGCFFWVLPCLNFPVQCPPLRASGWAVAWVSEFLSRFLPLTPLLCRAAGLGSPVG